MPFKKIKSDSNVEQNVITQPEDVVNKEVVNEEQPMIVRYIMTNTFPELSEDYLKTVQKFIEQKGRRYFGSPGSGLFNQLIDPKYKEMGINRKAVEAGAKGEQSTSEVLRKWIDDKPNVVLVDSIHLKLDDEEEEETGVDEEEGSVNRLGDTDHLLIIGDTVIIIDSKNWKEKASYSVGEGGAILRSKNEFSGSHPNIVKSKFLWKKYYEGIDVSVQAFICIANPNSFIMRDNSWWSQGWKNFKLVNQETLIYFLDKLWEEEGMKNIDYIHIDVVAKAVKGIQEPYNKYKAQFPTFYRIINK